MMKDLGNFLEGFNDYSENLLNSLFESFNG